MGRQNAGLWAQVFERVPYFGGHRAALSSGGSTVLAVIDNVIRNNGVAIVTIELH